MSGIVKNNEALIGGVASTADTHTITDTADIQIFTTTGSNRTWAKPSWATTVYIECIGGGASGGNGHYGSGGRGGGGGAGGAMARATFDAQALAPTMAVVVGATVTALNNGNLKFVYAKTIKEGKLLKEVRGPIEQIERHIKKGEEVDIVELRDDYGIEYNVDDEPLDDLFDIGYNDPDNPDGLALRDMSIVYDQRGDMYLMDTEDIKKYH